MLGRIRRFVQRNIGKIAIGAVAIPVFIRLTGYAANRYLTYQAAKTHELLLRYKKQRMFEMMEENFESTFRKWFELMKETIKKTLDAEIYAERLKKGEGNKMENWTEMKIIAFANILALVYGSSLLNVLLRIQVNVISGLLFKQMEEIPPGLEDMGGAGDASSSSTMPAVITEEMQQEYMVLTRYLCTDGVKHLCELMRDKARHAIENLSLKQKLTIADIEQLFLAIRKKELARYQVMRLDIAENDAAELNDWCPISEAWFFMCSVKLTKKYLYPELDAKAREDRNQTFLRTLIGEAFDLIKSPDSKNLLRYLEAQGVNNYLDRISEFLNTQPVNPDSDESQISIETSSPFSETEIIVPEVTAPVAKLIPVMNSFINVPFSEDTWVNILLNNQSLKIYSANIYESYSSKEFD